ncbi:MAG TPA: XdhC/CoxI family protein [Thermoleophilia bacterium]|nr:XdhC/CoxI family protein [Thermoleophilia bacterium]
MRDIAAELREWDAAGDEIALATVVETWGSSPRPLASKMAVTRSGKMAGSVSNGCIEGAVFEEAQKVLESGRAKLCAFGVADDLAFEVGLACGGHIEVFVQPLSDSHREAISALAEEREGLLTTDLESGATAFTEGATDTLQPVRRDGQFVEPVATPAQMVIVGAIHIAIPLHRLAKLMGYRVTVVDARSQFATKERFPEADAVVVAWPDDGLSGLRLDRSTALVILTHDPKFDLPALRAALASKAGYIGAIGSRKTNANRLEKLREEGYAAGDLARVHGPIGLDLGGRSAEETALAIMAEVVATAHGAAAGYISRG